METVQLPAPRPEMLQKFWNFCQERHLVYLRKFIQKMPPPWTEDTILRDYHFTNILRDLDRGTLWAIKHLYPIKDERSRFLNLILYRAHNNITFYEALREIYPINASTFDPKVYSATVLSLQAQGSGIFTAAHRPPGGVGKMPKGKGTRTRLFLETTVTQHMWPNFEQVFQAMKTAKNMQELYDSFRPFKGIGEFFRMEFTEDVMRAGLCQFKTEGDWTHAGPGCRNGLDHVFFNDGLKPSEVPYEDEIRWLQKNQPGSLVGIIGRHMRLRDVEHSLCEFSKYRAAEVGKRPRRRHKPHTSPLPEV